MEESTLKLSHYHVYERIGGGGFATVYLARDTRTNQVVALKVLHPHLAQDSEFVARFRREAEALQQLPAQPNIVHLHEFAQEGNTCYLTMEYLEGQDLSQILAQRKRLPVNEALSITAQIAQALDAAYHHGLVHRDIKPSNIKVTPQGVAKVMDFGIARAAEGTRLTQTGMFVGTPDYMAPEIWEGKPADIRSDIYSLGALLYEMLTGAAPFHSETPAAIMHKQLMEQPPSVRATRADVPANIEAIIARMMAKQPETRYQTPGEVIAALRGETHSEAPTIISRAPRVQAQTPRASTPLMLIAAGGALLTLLLTILAFAPNHGNSAAPVRPTPFASATFIVAALGPTNAPVPVPTFTPTLPPTETPIPPSATPTETPVPPSATPEPSDTPTEVPPTATPMNIVVTATSAPSLPTALPTESVSRFIYPAPYNFQRYGNPFQGDGIQMQWDFPFQLGEDEWFEVLGGGDIDDPSFSGLTPISWTKDRNFRFKTTRKDVPSWLPSNSYGCLYVRVIRAKNGKWLADLSPDSGGCNGFGF